MNKKNFYLFYGENSSTINREVLLLKNKLDISEDNIINYNIEEIDSIIEEALTLSLFATNKFIIIDATNYLSNKKNIDNIDKLEKYFEHYNDTCYMVFISYKDTIDNRKKLVKLITSKGKIKRIDLNENYLINFIESYLQENQYQMNKYDIKYFISKIGKNVDNIKNELDKLFFYKLDTKEIFREDIDKLTDENRDDNIFDLVGSILKKDHKKAMTIYYDFLNKGIDSYSLIPIIASQVRLLFQVKRLYNKGKNNNEISSILGFKNPYRVKYLLQDSYYYTEEDLLDILKLLADMDKKIKTGMIDNKVAMELFIAGKDM